jgi:hypothetical protein
MDLQSLNEGRGRIFVTKGDSSEKKTILMKANVKGDTDGKVGRSVTIRVVLSATSPGGIEKHTSSNEANYSIVFPLGSDFSQANGDISKIEQLLLEQLALLGYHDVVGFNLANYQGEPAFRFFFNKYTKVLIRDSAGKVNPVNIDSLNLGAPDDGKDLNCVLSLSFPFITTNNKLFCACDQIVLPARYLRKKVLQRGDARYEKMLTTVG